MKVQGYPLDRRQQTKALSYQLVHRKQHRCFHQLVRGMQHRYYLQLDPGMPTMVLSYQLDLQLPTMVPNCHLDRGMQNRCYLQLGQGMQNRCYHLDRGNRIQRDHREPMNLLVLVEKRVRRTVSHHQMEIHRLGRLGCLIDLVLTVLDVLSLCK